MRLDTYLVKLGYFDSRQKAKEAIKRGFVSIDSVVVTKPSKNVTGVEKIEVRCEGKPKGYWKLKEIDEKFGLLKSDYEVLDVGSSAGGFLMYSAEKCKKVLGVEFSEEFRPHLIKITKKYRNVDIIFADIFTLEIKTNFDVILVDVSLDLKDSLKIVSKLSKKVREKMLLVAKDVRLNSVEQAKRYIESCPLEVTNVMTSKKRESYLLLE